MMRTGVGNKHNEENKRTITIVIMRMLLQHVHDGDGSSVVVVS